MALDRRIRRDIFSRRDSTMRVNGRLRSRRGGTRPRYHFTDVFWSTSGETFSTIYLEIHVEIVLYSGVVFDQEKAGRCVFNCSRGYFF